MSKIQNSDVKSEAELITAGASASSLIHDSKIYVTGLGINKTLDDAIIDGDIGGSGQGGINYVENYDFELNASGYSVYQDAPASSPVDGTGGVANVTFVRSTSSPLRGVASGLLTKSAINRQGEGWSYPITIDVADQAKMLRVSFDYATSVNYKDADIKLFIYDITNSALIEIVDRDLLANANGKFIGSFQSSPNSVNYRLIAHIASASALDYTVRFDNVKVGPQELSSGAIVTDWESYTPSFSAGFGTVTSIEAKYRRVGSVCEIEGSFVTGTVAASVGTMTMPPGLVSDAIATFPQGRWYRNDSTGSTIKAGPLATVNGFSSLYFTRDDYTTASSPFTNAPVSSIASNSQIIRFNISFPVAGWSSNMKISENLGNRDVSFLAQGATGTLTSGVASAVTFTTSLKDSTSSYSSGTFTAPESGDYDIEGSLQIGGTAAVGQTIGITLNKNGASTRTTFYRHYTATSTNLAIPFKFFLTDLKKGDTLDIDCLATTTSPVVVASNVYNWLAIKKRQSPQTLAGGEVVAARYTSNSGQAIGAGATLLTYEDPLQDTHNAYNTSSGVYTVPVSGWYNVGCGYRGAAQTLSTTQAMGVFIYVNGANRTQSIMYGNGASLAIGTEHHDLMYLSKGDTVSIYGSYAIATTMGTATNFNYFYIAKVN